MSFFGFGQSADIEIELDGADTRKLVELKQEDGRKDRYYLYYDGETVSGKVNLSLKKTGSRLEHQGIKIEFVGQIELYYDRGNHHEFTSLVKELARPGELIHNTSYDFEFNQVEKPYESYTGTNVRLRYFLRVTVVRRISDIVREMDLIVHTLSSYPDSNNSIKMEVGIEDCLHIEFEYNKSKYHLKDVIVGKIYFLLVRIKIKHMEIAIMKRETTGSGPNTFNENETIAKYEIMDGAPVRGESIPIRVFLAGYDLTPSMRDINKKFSVRYYLNLVLVDEEERRYFKQQEITLWRKGERVRRPLQEQLLAQQQAMSQLHLTGPQHHNIHDTGRQPVGETVPPLGAEPPSPHQSQSPMQEEIPPVPHTLPTTGASFLQHQSEDAAALRHSQDMNDSTPPTTPAAIDPTLDSTTPAAIDPTLDSTTPADTDPTLDSTTPADTDDAPVATNNGSSSCLNADAPSSASLASALPTSTEESTDTAPPPQDSILPDVTAVSSKPLQVNTMPAPEPPLAGSSTPPPLPSCPSTPLAGTPPPIEDTTNGTNSPPPIVDDNDDKLIANTKLTMDIPPLQVCTSEPPELPSPPSGPLDSPEDEEFVEASAASPPARANKKEAVAVAQ